MNEINDLLLSVLGNENNINIFLRLAAYLLLAPVAGGLLAGVDRRLTAWMQGRVGPPILQPFYDVFKLLKKEYIIVNVYQNLFVLLFFVFVVFSG
jgi:formate hydrogenlyase subunit 4